MYECLSRREKRIFLAIPSSLIWLPNLFLVGNEKYLESGQKKISLAGICPKKVFLELTFIRWFTFFNSRNSLTHDLASNIIQWSSSLIYFSVQPFLIGTFITQWVGNQKEIAALKKNKGNYFTLWHYFLLSF